MMFKTIFVVAALCAALTMTKKWDSHNDPSNFGSNYEYSLKKLPTKKHVTNVPWSDTYWPSFQGGIANRWQDKKGNYSGFGYHLYTKDELLSGKVDTSILSPAEKYDILMSRYDYPLVHSEWSRCSPSDATWEGLCHGWAPAASAYLQPSNVTFQSGDKVVVPLGSSDVKALLTYFLAEFASDEEDPRFLAQRCNVDIEKNTSAADLPSCWDIHPGAFHVVMANEIGLNNTAFVGDIDRSIQVWNQPISGYEYQLGDLYEPFDDAAPGTYAEQFVSFTIYYTKETVPEPEKHDALTYNAQYGYYLDIDKKGTILGGDWNTWDRLDFIWSEKAPAFYGYFESVGIIYNASISPNALAAAAPVERRAVSLASYKPTIVTGNEIDMDGYTETTRRAWLVDGAAGPNGEIRVHFTRFSTRRHRDFVRVYEVDEHGGIGAPVAVLHGSATPSDLTVRSGRKILLAFSVDRRAGRKVTDPLGSGFSASISRQ